MTTRQKRAARELVEKLDALADDIEQRLDGASADIERNYLEGRLSAYRHAAKLARNTLGVPE